MNDPYFNNPYLNYLNNPALLLKEKKLRKGKISGWCDKIWYFSAIKLKQEQKDTKKSRFKRPEKVATHGNAVKTKLERSEETRNDVFQGINSVKQARLYQTCR